MSFNRVRISFLIHQDEIERNDKISSVNFPNSMDFFIFLIAAVGMTHIMVDGWIFIWWRNWLEKWSTFFHKMFTCYQCFGFHAGWSLSLLWNPLPLEIVPSAIICALTTSFAAMLGAAILTWLNLGVD